MKLKFLTSFVLAVLASLPLSAQTDVSDYVVKAGQQAGVETSAAANVPNADPGDNTTLSSAVPLKVHSGGGSWLSAPLPASAKAPSARPLKAPKVAEAEYFQNDSSIFGEEDRHYGTTTLKQIGGKWYLLNFYGSTDTLSVNIDATTGTVSIPAQKILTNETYGAVWLYPIYVNGSRLTYDPTGTLTGTIDDHGTITVGPWGVFVGQGEAQAGGVFNAFTSGKWYAANATISNVDKNHASTSYEASVQQTSENEIAIYGFGTTARPVYASINSSKRVKISPQLIGYATALGLTFEFYCFPLDTTRNSMDRTLPIIGQASGDTITLHSWAVASRLSGSTQSLTAYKSQIVLRDSITWPVATPVSFTGSGTESDPYSLKTVADFVSLSTDVDNGNTYAGKYFRVDADIDFSSLGGASWQPVGSADAPFSAKQVDGQNHTISNLVYNARGSYYQGLFGYLPDTTAIKNLKLDNISITGNGNNYGALVGTLYGSVSNVTITNANIVSDGLYTGGIAGWLDGDITKSSTSGSIHSYGVVGGLVGYLNKGDVTDVHSSANVYMDNYSSTYSNTIGGLFGTLNGTRTKVATLTDSWFEGTVNENSGYGYAGGLIGFQQYGTVTRSFNTGTVRATRKSSNDTATGGIAGYTFNAVINDSYNAGRIIKDGAGSDWVGGLVGYMSLSYSSMSGAQNLNDISGSYNSGQITFNSASADISHNDIWGSGFISANYGNGFKLESQIHNSYSDGQIADIKGPNSRTTAYLTSGSLPEGFSNAWTLAKGRYPALNIADGANATAVSTSVITLADNDNSTKVKSPATLSAASNVKWTLRTASGKTSQTGDAVTISGNNVSVKAFGTDTLVAYVDGANVERAVALSAVPKAFSGNGTKESPYLITSVADYETLDSAVGVHAQRFEGDYFKQTADIDFKNSKFRGVGAGNQLNEFRGSFDGQGHKISNLNVRAWYKNPDGTGYIEGTFNYGGLFHIIGFGGEVKNLVIDSTCSFDLYKYGGAAVGMLRGKLSGITNRANVSGIGNFIGGVVGFADTNASITDTYNSGNVTGGDGYVGGIAGELLGTGARLQNDGNVSTHAITGAEGADSTDFVVAGGIIGYLAGHITDVVNQGMVWAADDIGGIAGVTSADTTTVDRALNTGFVYATNKALRTGAIVGYNFSSKVSDSYYDNSVNTDGAVENAGAKGAKGLSTSELTNGKALDGLTSSLLSYESGKYPVLKAYASEDAAGVLRQTKVDFAKEESRKNIGHSFGLSKNAKWSLAVGKNYSVKGDSLVLGSISTTELVYDTLTANAGKYTKLYFISSIPKLLDGSGTVADPYRISTVADWNKLANFVESTGTAFTGFHFIVLNDISFKDSTFVPLATGTYTFDADLNGNGKTLSDFVINNTSRDTYIAPIGTLASEGVVRNITFNGSVTGYRYVGGVVGKLYGTLRNVVNKGAVEASNTTGYVGGLAAETYEGALIDSCANDSSAKVTVAVNYVGGLVAQNGEGATIHASHNSQPFNAAGSRRYYGGLAAYNYGDIIDSWNEGDIKAGSYIGGLAAQMRGTNMTVSNSYNKATLTGAPTSGTSYVGGIVGSMSGSSASPTSGVFSKVWNTGDIVGQGSVGGIAGYGYYVTVAFDSCYNTGTIVSTNGRSGVGGLFGSISAIEKRETWPTLTNSYNLGDVTGDDDNVGGLAGSSSYYNVSDSYNLGDVSATKSGSTGSTEVGGIFGSSYGHATRVWNAGNVTATGYGVGGYSGNGNDETENVLTDVFNLGNVTADGVGLSPSRFLGADAAGIWGYGNITARNCYNMGDVTAPEAVAGFAGDFMDDAVVENSYVAGKVIVTGSAKSDAYIFCRNDAEITTKGNYYDATINDVQLADSESAVGVQTRDFYDLVISDHFVNHVASYPTLASQQNNPVANFFAADTLFAAGDKANAITKEFKYGNLEGVNWTSSSNIWLADGVASPTAEGDGWIEKQTTFQGRTFTKRYTLHVATASGIKDVNTIVTEDDADAPVYDLSGKLVGKDVKRLSKGVYIRGGKKFVVK